MRAALAAETRNYPRGLRKVEGEVRVNDQPVKSGPMSDVGVLSAEVGQCSASPASRKNQFSGKSDSTSIT